jgi:hypothetical protein
LFVPSAAERQTNNRLDFCEKGITSDDLDIGISVTREMRELFLLPLELLHKQTNGDCTNNDNL